MSAYMMQDNDFLTMVNYIMRNGYIPSDTVYAVANALKRVNLESVNYRYKEKTGLLKLNLALNRMMWIFKHSKDWFLVGNINPARTAKT